jgi:tetratricopeptide (TPR) repeat protein
MRIVFIISFFCLQSFWLIAQKANIGEDYIKQIEGKIDKARISIDKTLATAEGKKSAENWYLKGYICLQLAKSEVYKSSFPLADSESLEAIKKSRELDTENKYLPECINVLYELSSMFYNKGITVYNKSVSNTDKTGLSEALRNFELFFEAVKVLGDDDKIVTNLMDHYKINRHSVVFYAGFSAHKCGLNDKADLYYSKLAGTDVPDDKAKQMNQPLAYIYYPELLESSGNMSKAISVVKKGAKIYPENPDVIMAAIDFHKKAGMVEEMADFLELALKSAPSNPKMLVVLAGAYTTVARSYDKKGYASTSADYRNKAIQAYEKALKSNPSDKNMLFNINYNMGILYYNPGVQAYKKQDEAGRAEAEVLFRKAVVYLEKALELDKKNKNVINMLLKCYQTLNDKSRAEELEKLLY